MESMRLGEAVMVSKYWTPDHIDVTDVPMTYARPKAAWIDRLDKRGRFKSLDEGDRLLRRRSHTSAFIDPAEITVLPPLRTSPLQLDDALESKAEERVPFFENLRSMTNAFRGRRLAG